jgi:two-component system CheB/CheR fusion protein
MDTKSREDLLRENEVLRSKLSEATDTLDAIRTGQIDALVVNGQNGHSLYTLKSADQAYRVFIEQMAEGAVSLNPDGLIIYSNSQFARIINQPLSQIVGRTLSEFVAPGYRKQFDALIREGSRQNVKGEVAIGSGDEIVEVQLSINALDVEGEPALSVIVTDLTFQKEAQKQLKSKNVQLETLNQALINSNHDLQQFASVASHDLQEPLRKIQVFSKFLKDRSFGELSDSSKQYLEKIISCSHRMKVLIVDILTYSRLSAGDAGLEQVDLKALCQEILEDFDLKIAEKNASITLGDLGTVQGNKGQLRQVFYNLISNALKFVSGERRPSLSIQRKEPNAKELGLSLDNESGYCRISFSDNGIGFDERYSSSIFSLFEKLNPKTTYEGSGIGLAIAKKIIDKHHGVITAKSTPGLGSEFNVVLPFKQPTSK